MAKMTIVDRIKAALIDAKLDVAGVTPYGDVAWRSPTTVTAEERAAADTILAAFDCRAPKAMTLTERGVALGKLSEDDLRRLAIEALASRDDLAVLAKRAKVDLPQ